MTFLSLRPHTKLPVEDYAESVLKEADANHIFCISAEPGAGKSTFLPLVFPDRPWMAGKKVLMLEPRRLVAKNTAKRLAWLVGEEVGESVGYRTGLETCTGKNARIEVVTEAILTRMLQSDPELADVGVVIFDEFHERNLHTDLGLSLALDVREQLRPDLRLIVMSATPDIASLQRIIPDLQTLHIPGRMFPVEVMYNGRHSDWKLEKRVVLAIEDAVAAYPGDVLVFLPGEGEIHRTAGDLCLPDDVEVLQLYGSLSTKQQGRVFAERAPGISRRVILSTAIAETGLTIDGVRIVIDSGYTRLPRFSPACGMDRLETVRVSMAAADQRKGRAGRTANGVCIRLWDAFDERGFQAQRRPEIQDADLCEFTLNLLQWGVTPDRMADFPLPEQPPQANYTYSLNLLRGLNAITDDFRMTKCGRQILALPVHPRLANMLLHCVDLNAVETGIGIAALLGERDFLHDANAGADISARLDALNSKSIAPSALDVPVKMRILATMERLRGCMAHSDSARSGFARGHKWEEMGRNEPKGEVSRESPGVALAWAYPDRIAKRHSTTADACMYTMANGVMAQIDRTDLLSRSMYLAVAETSTLNGKTKIRLAAPLSEGTIYDDLADEISTCVDVFWDDNSKSVRAERIESIGSLVLSRRAEQNPPSDKICDTLLAAIAKIGIAALNFTRNEQDFCNRVNFLHHCGVEDFPDYSEDGLMGTLDRWLAPYLDGFRRLDDLKKLNFTQILQNALPSGALMKMRTMAPERIEVPSGSMIRVDYSNPDQPMISVRLQELFGLRSTPVLANGKIPLLMDILSPAMRTVQRTSDLKNFWETSYILVRKDMRGRYPKHDWPEDPANAIPHRGVRSPRS